MRRLHTTGRLERLEQLERSRRSDRDQMLIIRLIVPGPLDFAWAGDETWAREPSESEEAFSDRVTADWKARHPHARGRVVLGPEFGPRCEVSLPGPVVEDQTARGGNSRPREAQLRRPS